MTDRSVSPTLSKSPPPGGTPCITAPQVNLPESGAIRAIGAKSTVKPSTGTSSLSVALVSHDGSGFVPKLNLLYDSGFPNGSFAVTGCLAILFFVNDAWALTIGAPTKWDAAER